MFWLAPHSVLINTIVTKGPENRVFSGLCLYWAIERVIEDVLEY
nr:MAG TPA: hypothetical protein [Caudoviricetes sp.]